MTRINESANEVKTKSFGTTTQRSVCLGVDETTDSENQYTHETTTIITRANFKSGSPVSSLIRLKFPSTLLHEPAHC